MSFCFSTSLIISPLTRFDVYETLCPQQMLVHKGGKIKNWSEECRNLMPTKLQCNTIQRALQSPNLQKEIIRKNKINLFFKFSSNNFLIIFYQLTKFEAPSCYSFRDFMDTNFQSRNLQREIIRKKYNNFFSNFHQLISSSSSIS